MSRRRLEDQQMLTGVDQLNILSAILLPIKPPVISAVIWIALLEAVFIASVVDFLATLASFWLYLLLLFLANDKSP